MAANVMKGNRPETSASKTKAKSQGKSPDAKMNFLINVVKDLHENAYGPAETKAVFESDEWNELNADAVPAPASDANITE